MAESAQSAYEPATVDDLLKVCEDALMEESSAQPRRELSIAITHLQTARLWLDADRRKVAELKQRQ